MAARLKRREEESALPLILRLPVVPPLHLICKKQAERVTSVVNTTNPSLKGTFGHEKKKTLKISLRTFFIFKRN